MRHETLSACPLAGGGVRYPLPPCKALVPLVLFSGLVLWGLGPPLVLDFLFNPRHAGSPREPLLFLLVLPLVWSLALLACFVRRSITLTEGRLGLAWWLGGRMVWQRWRGLADVRRLVVRRDGDSLVAGCAAAGPLVLARHCRRGMLLPVAHDLARRCRELTGVEVSVGEEELPFTRERAQQPIFSRVKAHASGPATTFSFPAVHWCVRRTESLPWRLVVDGRPYLARCAAGLGLMLLGVLLAAGAVYTAVNHALGRPSAIVVRTGTVTVPGPPPSPFLTVRLREAAADCGRTLLVVGPLAVVGLWLLVRSWKEAARRRGEKVERQRTVLRCRRPVLVTLEPAALSLGVPGAPGPAARWPAGDLLAVEPFLVCQTSSSEGGGTTTVTFEGLRIQTEREEWVLQGGTGHADWAWLATRIRSALGLDGPACRSEQITAAAPGQIHSRAARARDDRLLCSPAHGADSSSGCPPG